MSGIIEQMDNWYRERGASFWAVTAISLFYLAAIFPLCFFRHDDWWILGNSALHLPGDWGFLWRPTLYFGGQEINWFFRPFFKLFTYVFYQVFSFHYYGWLLGLFAAFLTTLALAYRALRDFSGKLSADTFICFFLAAVPLHLGSLAWIGEGLMNVPQALCLTVVTACWMRLSLEKAFRITQPALWVGLAFFTLSLGFKESTVFHLALLAGMTLSEKQFGFLKKPQIWISYFAPFAIVACVYLLIRLGWMPWNQSYRPEFSLPLWAASAARFLSVPIAAVVLWVALDAGTDLRRLKKWADALIRRSWWLAYFGVSTVVYLGQNFFSPGWWYLPSLYLAFLMAFAQQDVGAPAKKGARAYRAVFGSFAIFLSLSLWQLNRMGWWHWGKLQREMHQMMVVADPQEVDSLSFYVCDPPAYPGVVLYRVVGDQEALRNQWALLHSKPLSVTYRECSSLTTHMRMPASIERSGEAAFAWNFPELSPVGERARRLRDLATGRLTSGD